MKWRRNKSALPSSSSSSSSSSSISVINRVFPVSWFSKSKQEGGSYASKNKQKCVSEFPTSMSAGLREGRFYSMDEDDAFWRLSFHDERIQGRRSTGGINPLWNDSDHEYGILVSDFMRLEAEVEEEEEEECRNFNEMVCDIKKMKERRGKQRIVAEGNGEKTRVPSTRQRNVDDQISRKLGVLVFGEKIERDIFPVETVCKSRKHQKKPIIDQNSVAEWRDFEGRKFKDIKIKPDSKKKSAYVNRGMKSCSPRTECKIRALEEMKRARTKSKKKEKVLEGITIFDSFAVAKSSFDPERDFRDSMVEMITEKGIGHPEDLEDLLACYLTLNRDKYHDLIIKVFRQVWFELKGMCVDPTTQNRIVRGLIR